MDAGGFDVSQRGREQTRRGSVATDVFMAKHDDNIVF